MSGTLKILFRRPLVRELILVCLGTAALVAAAQGKHVELTNKQICAALGMYLLLTPNGWSIFGAPRTKRKGLDKNGTTRVKLPKTLGLALKELGAPTGERYLVIGGLGFVGERIATALYARGERNVACVSRSVYAHSKAQFQGKIDVIQGDVLDKATLQKAMEGADVVFAPVAEMCFFDWMPHHFSRNAWKNVEGVRNVVECAKEAGVKRLIFTGSCLALYHSEIDIQKGYDEGDSSATKNTAISLYGYSKSLAEQLVLAANGSNGMATGLIRPFSCVIGFRDRNFFDRFIMRSGVLCSMENVPLEWLDVDDVVHAELLLEKRLRNGPKDDAAGEAFNISPPQSLTWTEFTREVDTATRTKMNGRRTRHIELPQRVMWLVVVFVDVLACILPFDVKKILGNDLGILTVSTVLTGTAQPTMNEAWRNEKARRVLGFDNLMSTQDTVLRILDEYKSGGIAHFQ